MAELLETERSYVKDLELAIKCFLGPMRAASSASKELPGALKGKVRKPCVLIGLGVCGRNHLASARAASVADWKGPSPFWPSPFQPIFLWWVEGSSRATLSGSGKGAFYSSLSPSTAVPSVCERSQREAVVDGDGGKVTSIKAFPLLLQPGYALDAPLLHLRRFLLFWLQHLIFVARSLSLRRSPSSSETSRKCWPFTSPPSSRS